ncbi:MAG: hypothetical protein GY945_04595 [Rhodobacteraceae bacterium]|nr:hypothetical protein [Paracoccaceae bacterium]
MPELSDFEGRWRIARRIEDALAGATGLFDGIAMFTRVEAGLLYEEAGELRLPDQAGMRATRRYLWREAQGGVDVCFEDGSDFHHIDLGRNVVTAWHDCLPDLYEVSYNFSHWPDWRAIWRVRGPKKDYTLITDYRRHTRDEESP